MNIEGQCHCGLVTYQADIDPEKVSICHCTDCQTLTGSPYRVTVICSGEQVRITGGAPKIYAKTGSFSAFLSGMWFAAVHERRGRSG